jgi:hypothetical protein
MLRFCARFAPAAYALYLPLGKHSKRAPAALLACEAP